MWDKGPAAPARREKITPDPRFLLRESYIMSGNNRALAALHELDIKLDEDRGRRERNLKIGAGERPVVDFRTALGLVAKRFYGTPNPEFSTKNELRFGGRGSLSVNLLSGFWFDNETNEGGGTLDLIVRVRGGDRISAVRWLAGSLKESGLKLRNDKAAESLDDVNLVKVPRDTPIVQDYVDGDNRLWFQGRMIESVYDYRDEAGDLLFQVLRYVAGSGRKFSQRRPVSGWGGYWIPNLDGVRKVPYRLPEFFNKGSGLMFVCEGEKDVDNLLKLRGGVDLSSRAGPLAALGLGSGLGSVFGSSLELGFFASCNPGGAGKWREEFNRYFVGFDVVILPDNDEVGRAHAEDVRGNLVSVADRVRVLELPGLEVKGDVSDWLGRFVKTRMERLKS